MRIDKWVFLGLVAAVFSPLPTGIIAGVILARERKYKSEGVVVLVLSVIVLALTLWLLYAGYAVGI